MPHQTFHRIAITWVSIVAVWNLLELLQSPSHPYSNPLFAIALWGVALWLLITRPEKSSHWIGAWLVGMLVLQFWLRSKAMEHLDSYPPELREQLQFLHFLPERLAIGAAAISCFILRFRSRELKTLPLEKRKGP